MLLKPVGFDPAKRYPLLVVAHGGPAGAYVNNYRVGGLEGGQVWAGQGWAVFYPNPRGSTNYGEKFLRANVADWGGGDFKDIMTGVDALIARGVADKDELAHIGWSYGGYMTAWAITQTNRFKAAMVGAGLTNMWSMYGTNDIPNVLIGYFGGIANKETLPLYMNRSAMTHIDNVTTPTLILHGGSDERVPIGQAQELFRGLKDRGKTTELVFYPREGHGIAEYYHQKDRLTRIRDWVTALRAGDGASLRHLANDRLRSSTARRRRVPPLTRRSDQERLATLFDLSREVTRRARPRRAAREDPAAHRPADAVRRVLGLSARRAPRRRCASPTPRAIRRKPPSGPARSSARARSAPRCRSSGRSCSTTCATDPRYIGVVPGVQSTLVVPLRHKGKALGALNLLSATSATRSTRPTRRCCASFAAPWRRPSSTRGCSSRSASTPRRWRRWPRSAAR